MHSLEENDYRELARVLREKMESRAPDWADADDSDPGVTLLELLAFITESLVARRDAISKRGRLGAARLARAALALAGGKGPEGCALSRSRYFSGRLITAGDLQRDQDYVRARLRRHNRVLHGMGIVRGLQVSVHPEGGGAGERVVVQPGFAVAPDGEDIEVCSETSAGLPEVGSQLFVMLSHAEHFTHPVAVSDEEAVQYTRVEETFALHLEATPGGKGIALARLNRSAYGWNVDQTFAAPHARCYQE